MLFHNTVTREALLAEARVGRHILRGCAERAMGDLPSGAYASS